MTKQIYILSFIDLSKPVPQCFLAVETAMLQIYSTLDENTLKKINSHAYITKTYHEGKPLPIGTFVLKRSFSHVHFSDQLKPLRIGPYKIPDRLSDVAYELLSQDGSTGSKKPLNPLLPKRTTFVLTFAYLGSTQFDIPKLINMRIVTPPLSIQMNLNSTKIQYQNL